MTLNGAMAVILRYFTKFGRSGADYIKVVKGGPILFAIKMSSKESSLQLSSSSGSDQWQMFK